ncbi:hypothetical protein [Pseudomonas aeruginosa]|uniref:hypothetical protein n=1 Tax=Pseudomonas aeruginosa TaxID=287 RepID=UPI001C37D5A8|nr:hypothetical protein [Pseudomonas aeruginosa]
MNKANECTCPSGDGSLVHPCPAHPAVEQAGGDERAADAKPCATRCPDCGEHDLMPGDLCACGYETDPATGYACSECDGSGEGCFGEICRECDGSGWFVTPDQARAALAQPSPAQTQPSPAPTLRAAIDVANDRFEVPVAKWGTDLVGKEERPEVVAYFDRNYPSTGDAFIWSNYEGSPYEPVMTVAQHDRIVGALRAVITQLHQHKKDYMDAGQETYRALQNEIREREAEIARLDGLVSVRTAERDAALAEVERIKTISDNYYVLCVERQQQLDAALARVAELERQEPVVRAYGVLPPFAEKVLAKLRRFYDCAEDFESGGVDIGRHWLDLLTQLGLLNRVQRSPALWEISQQGEDLLEAPVAQAQHSVPEGWMLMPVEPLLNMMSDKDHDTRITAERQLLSILAAAPGKEVGHE